MSSACQGVQRHSHGCHQNQKVGGGICVHTLQVINSSAIAHQSQSLCGVVHTNVGQKLLIRNKIKKIKSFLDFQN
jgi:hypothetical protein